MLFYVFHLCALSIQQSLNNPLKYTDPSGQWAFLLTFISAVATQTVITAIGTQLLLAQIAIAYAVTYTVTYAATGDAKAAQGAGLAAGLFMGIGGLRGGKMGVDGNMAYKAGWESGSMKTLAAHGLAGGIVQDRMGGSFGAGFLAGSLGSYLGSSGHSNSATELIGNTVRDAVVGGTISVVGGGKFANGAQTGAFRYLFNESMHAGEGLRVRFFNNSDERLDYLEGIGPEGNFDGDKQGVMDAIALYAKGPFAKDLAQDGYLDIIYNTGEPKGVANVIKWNGYSYRGAAPDTVFAHEFGHTDYGGAYRDHELSTLSGPLGNVARTNVYRAWKRSTGASGYKHRTGYKFNGKCYAPSGYPGGSC